MLSEK